MLKNLKKKKFIQKNVKNRSNFFLKKKNFKPWWFPYRSRFLRKRNKFYLKWKKNKIFKKYKFFFKRKKRQIFKIKLKKIFTTKLVVKNFFKKIFGLSSNNDFTKFVKKNPKFLFYNLENRLDVILSKNFNIRNLKQAQRIIKAGLVYLNNKKIYKINAIIKPSDVIYLERDGTPWKIRNLTFRKKRKKRSFNNYISKKIPLLINFKNTNLKYAIPTKFLNNKTFKILTWYYR